MRLAYRGIHYENHNFRLEMNQSEIGGKYRGQNWRYQYPRHIPEVKPRVHLKYRGLDYTSNFSAQGKENSLTQAREKMGVCAVPIKKTYSGSVNEAHETHWENIRRNLERRLQVAKDSGNEKLVTLLEEESRQLAINRPLA